MCDIGVTKRMKMQGFFEAFLQAAAARAWRRKRAVDFAAVGAKALRPLLLLRQLPALHIAPLQQ
jgi:hypothetical protein